MVKRSKLLGLVNLLIVFIFPRNVIDDVTSNVVVAAGKTRTKRIKSLANFVKMNHVSC